MIQNMWEDVHRLYAYTMLFYTKDWASKDFGIGGRPRTNPPQILGMTALYKPIVVLNNVDILAVVFSHHRRRFM